MSPLFKLWHWGRVAPVAALLLTGCDRLEFSPNDHRVPEEFTDLTQKNLARLQARPLAAADTLRFVFTGDSQQFYDEAEALVASVNQQPGIALLLVAGDISDFGLAREMRWVDEKLRKLTVPYLTVVGNHDLVGNGRAAYQHVFGALNYSFVYGDTKFILVDTNGREYNFNGQVPDLGWLRPQLATLDGARRQVVVSHVPPTNSDFDPALRLPYAQALRDAPGLVFEMNGHNHQSTIGQPFNDGVTYVNSSAFSERRYMVVTVWGDREFRIKQVAF
ncbi:metallophosphoesterase family protein [Hymenobacter sp. IS2118]|uniref:metallophosphoesterase family protein n=1 Tax=Hymenobacter sp. IS2118 TaxID=1505605 RepID=UPI0006901DC4|nr:metallophosphoesterase [Hymenobacter sp. IS2118]